MLGLVRKKTLVAAFKSNSSLQAQMGEVAEKNLTLMQDVAKQMAATQAVEHQREVAMKVAASAEKERDKAVEDFNALERLHARRIRVGTFTVNPLKLTAQLRAIEPRLRVEFDGDQVVVYADSVLKPEVARAVSGFLNGQWDWT